MNSLRSERAFTLIELLVVTAIIAILVSLLLPALVVGRDKAAQVQCASNLRQLCLANTQHANDYGYYAPASEDMLSGGNLKRWHGERDNISMRFDSSKGPLAPYLGGSGGIRQCLAFRDFRDDSGQRCGFEAGNGGYGYNALGVGSEAYLWGYVEKAMLRGMRPGLIEDPHRTVMFCDSAFPQPYGSPDYLIEYSFAEPHRFVRVADGEIVEYGNAQPSTHFRHRGRANVVWCDGHVSTEKLSDEHSSKFTEFNVGWFGPDDNSLFDPF